MKIKNIEIKGYRSLKKVKINDLKDINLFHGDNNTGKSNILRALELFFSPKINKKRIIAKKPGETDRDVEVLDFEGRIEISNSDFYNFGKSNIQFTIDIVMDNKELTKIIPNFKSHSDFKPKKDDINIISISADISYDLSEDPETGIEHSRFFLTKFTINGTDIYGNKKYADILEDMEYYLMDSFVNVSCKRQITKEYDTDEENDKISPNSFQKYLYELSISDEIEARNILKEIKEKFDIINKDIGEITFCIKREKSEINSDFILDKDLEKITKKRNEIKLMILNLKENIILPIDNIGSGIQQSLTIIANIVANKNSFLYGIEELEANLSPTSQTVLFSNIRKMMEEKNFGINQLFITSHSIAFSKRNIENVGVYMVEHDENETSVKISSFEDIIRFFGPYQTYFNQRLNKFLKDNKIEKKDKMKSGELATYFFDELIWTACDSKDALNDPWAIEKIFEEIKKDIGKKYIIEK